MNKQAHRPAAIPHITGTQISLIFNSLISPKVKKACGSPNRPESNSVVTEEKTTAVKASVMNIGDIFLLSSSNENKRAVSGALHEAAKPAPDPQVIRYLE